MAAQVSPPESSEGDQRQPVEVYQTGEGVIVSSNRRANPDEGGAEPIVERADTTPAPATPPAAAPPLTSTIRDVPIKAGTASTSAATAVVWIALVVVLLGVAVLLWVRHQRRRTTARHAALLAGSLPLAAAPDGGRPGSEQPGGAPLGEALVASPSSAPPSSSAAGERSSPRGALSGINAPPPSERQWLSQPPPRSVKDPPG